MTDTPEPTLPEAEVWLRHWGKRITKNAPPPGACLDLLAEYGRRAERAAYWERRFQEQCADGDEQATQRLALHGRITELEAGRDVEQTMLRNAAATIQAAEAECDRLRAALAYAEEVGGQAIRAEAQAVRDLEEELVAVRSQRDAALALHVATDVGQCSTCSNEDAGSAAEVRWPCDTARSLGVEV